MMAPRYDEAPEVAASVSPEVHHPPTGPEFNPYGFQQHQQQIGGSPIKPDVSPIQPPGGGYALPAYGTSGYGTPNAPGSYYGHHGQSAGYAPLPPPSPGRQSKAKTICGCTVAVFILSMIIALLSVAVVGLAAGTGVEASRASDAESSLAAYKASHTSTAPSSTSTGDFSALDRNCSSDPSGTTGDTYASAFFTESQYTVYCNRDTPNAPLSSLFVANLDDCMDACSSWSYYAPSDFPNGTATNQTCSGVSFIPAWTNRTTAVAGTAPGNCYLKPGPQNETSLYTPNNGQETHAAIIVDS